MNKLHFAELCRQLRVFADAQGDGTMVPLVKNYI